MVPDKRDLSKGEWRPVERPVDEADDLVRFENYLAEDLLRLEIYLAVEASFWRDVVGEEHAPRRKP
jgi:hypothetical protein